MDQTQRFMAAFKGFEYAHGQTKIQEERVAGKQKANSRIIREPLTEELVESHLKGILGVGSIPINENNKCNFGALDIDTYPLDLVALDKKLRAAKVPCIVCRSKSGGAHIFFFFTEEILAGEFRDKASEIASYLGFGGCEIFPKQEQVLVERGDVGNFINLPYFDSEQTMRYAVKENGKNAKLTEFLTLVKKRSVSPKDFLNISLGGQSNMFKDWPPCLRVMMEQGIPEGTRNTTMFNVAILCKMMDPDNWKSNHEKINTQYCQPPLPASDIVTIQNQMDKKEYFYTCDQEPMKSFCNKTLCKTLKYGVGNQKVTMDLAGLSVVMSEPRLWFMDVNGRRLELTTEELQMPVRFQRACMEQLSFMPDAFKANDWQILVNGLMENLNEIEVPDELTFKGQFFEHMEAYCTGRIQAQSAEEIILGKPYTREGFTFFRLDSLMGFLRQRKFDDYSRAQVQERLKEMNGDQEANGQKRFRTSKGEWKTIRVWWIPEFTQEVDVPDVEIEKTEVPF